MGAPAVSSLAASVPAPAAPGPAPAWLGPAEQSSATRAGAAGLLRGAVLLAVVTAAARLAGFLRSVLLVQVLGTTTLADAYTAANALPTLVFEIVAGGALAGAVVPVLVGQRDAAGDRSPGSASERQTIAALLTWSTLLLLPLALLLVLARRPLAALLLGTGPDSAGKVDVGARLLLVFAPQVVLYGLAVVATGVLQAKRRYLAAAVAPLLSTAVVAAGYFAFAASGSGRSLSTLRAGGTALLAGGTTAGVLALAVTALVPVLRGEPGLRPGLRYPPGVAARLRRLGAGGLAAVAAQQLWLVITLRLAANEAGGVVVWTLAWTVLLVPWAVVAMPVVTRTYPPLAAAARTARTARTDPTAAEHHPDAEQGAGAEFAATLRTALGLVLGGSMVAAGLLAGCAGPLARLLVSASPAAGSASLARALVALAFALPGFAVAALLARALWAIEAPWAAAAATSAGWAVAIAVELVLAPGAPRGWGPAALGLGAAAGTALSAGLLAVCLRRTGPPNALRGAARPMPRALLAAAGAGVGAAGLSRLLTAQPTVLELLASAGAGLLAAAVVLRAGGWAGFLGPAVTWPRRTV